MPAHSPTHSLMDPAYRDDWLDSLAYVTFAERVKPRTHIFKVQAPKPMRQCRLCAVHLVPAPAAGPAMSHSTIYTHT